MFRSVKEVVDMAEENNISVSEVMIRREMDMQEKARDVIIKEMDKNLQVMENAVKRSLCGIESVTGLNGRDAILLQQYMKDQTPLSDSLLLAAVAKAMGTNEANAAMGTICAAPTAGSAGCVPGTLFAVKNRLNPTREQMIRYLFTAGAFG